MVIYSKEAKQRKNKKKRTTYKRLYITCDSRTMLFAWSRRPQALHVWNVYMHKIHAGIDSYVLYRQPSEIRSKRP